MAKKVAIILGSQDDKGKIKPAEEFLKNLGLIMK